MRRGIAQPDAAGVAEADRFSDWRVTSMCRSRSGPTSCRCVLETPFAFGCGVGLSACAQTIRRQNSSLVTAVLASVDVEAFDLELPVLEFFGFGAGRPNCQVPVVDGRDTRAGEPTAWFRPASSTAQGNALIGAKLQA